MVIAFFPVGAAIGLQSRAADEMGKTFEGVAMFRGLAGATKCVTAAAVLLLASTGANANLVTNGGFETGDFTGWTQFGDPSFTGVGAFGSAHSGTYEAFFGPSSGVGGIFQTLSTTIGATYQIDFWLEGGGNPSSFEFNWNGGAAEVSLINPTPSAYTQYTLSLVASSNSTDLRFGFSNPPNFFYLDDVSVVAAAPEPGTLALIGLSLAGLAATRRRK